MATTGLSRKSSGLLRVILRGRNLSQIQHPFLRQIPIRELHGSQQTSENVYPITFGPETDELIGTYTKTTKRPPKTARKTKGTRSSLSDSSKHLPSTGSIEITLNNEQGEILATKPAAAVKSNLSESPSPASELTESHYNSASSVLLEQDTRNEGASSKSRLERDQAKSTPKAVSGSNTTQWQRKPLKRSESWQVQKDALERKFGEAKWNPRKKLSPDAIQGLRELHAENPERYSTPILADKFKVSPEAIRRILKSKWRATPTEMEDRRQRWARRHDRIWDHKAALGQRPQREKDRAPEGPEAFEEELRAKQMLGQI